MRQKSPAASRNRKPILGVLRQILPSRGVVLEIASGTGEHAVYFARHLPALIWQPSEMGPLESISAWQISAALPNMLSPVYLDVTQRPWPLSRADAIFCANMIHIAPWEACRSLFFGAQETLPPGAPLLLYGPFFRYGVRPAPSNVAFDKHLRSRNTCWGIRELDSVEAVANRCHFTLEAIIKMPANNLVLNFRKRSNNNENKGLHRSPPRDQRP